MNKEVQTITRANALRPMDKSTRVWWILQLYVFGGFLVLLISASAAQYLALIYLVSTTFIVLILLLQCINRIILDKASITRRRCMLARNKPCKPRLVRKNWRESILLAVLTTVFWALGAAKLIMETR